MLSACERVDLSLSLAPVEPKPSSPAGGRARGGGLPGFASASALEPLWLVRPPDRAGPIDDVLGPEERGARLVAFSSAIGLVELDPETGELSGQKNPWSGDLPKLGSADRAPVDDGAGGRLHLGRDGLRLESRTGGFHRPFDEEPLQLSNPMRVGEHIALIRDESLEARRLSDGAIEWTAEGRHAPVSPGLWLADGQILALALDNGVGPVWVDPADGSRLRRGETVAAIAVLAARRSRSGVVIAFVREDSSLKRDAIAVFEPSGTLRGLWRLPTPRRPRTEPAHLELFDGRAVLFYGGRTLAAFALE